MGGGERKMRKGFLSVSITLIISMLFIANSVVAAAWAEDWDKAMTVATQPANILGPNDRSVASIGISTNYTGIIYIIINSTFQLGIGNDIIVYGRDVDLTSEQYAICHGIWDVTPVLICSPGGSSYDSNGTVYFDLGSEPGTFNMIVICALTGGGGTWPGPEIDAVYAIH